MVVGAAGYQLHAPGGQAVGQGCSVLHDLAGVLLEGGGEGFPEADRLGGNHMLQRAALGAGEDGRVDALGNVFVVGQDQAAPGPAQGLVGGGGHHVGVGHRILVHAAGHQARNMGHIHHEHGAVAVGDLAQLGPGIGGSTGHQQFGTDLGHLLGQGVVVDEAVFVHAIRNKVVVLAAHVHRGTVGQMTALGQVHAHDGVAHIEQGKVDGQVGLGAGMGLHVGVLGAEELASPADGDVLHLVHILAAAVVTVAGITFGILVGEHAAHGGYDGGGDDVLAGNQLNVLALAHQFPLHGGAQFGVGGFHKADGVHHILIHS